MGADYYISKLGLLPHPEGGFYKETYRAKGTVNDRSYSTAIYFLLTDTSFSALHRIKSDEVWHFYAGESITIIELTPTGELIETLVGNDLDNSQGFQYTVKAGHWFGSFITDHQGFALVGCTVAPGFDFQDFEMGDSKQLLKEYPQHTEIINQLTR